MYSKLNHEEFFNKIKHKYAATECGKILSLYRNGKLLDKPRDLKQHLTNCGYKFVILGLKDEVKNFTVHRFVYAYFNNWPKKMIDHINQDKTDNRIKNLREVKPIENMFNRKMYNNGKSKGVCFWKKRKKYQARLSINGKRTHLGFFNTETEAAAIVNKVLLTILKGES